jgi:hypothetical protein
MMSDSLESLEATMNAAAKAADAAAAAWRKAFVAQYRLQPGDMVRGSPYGREVSGRVERVEFNSYGAIVVAVRMHKKDGTLGLRETTMFGGGAARLTVVEKAATR